MGGGEGEVEGGGGGGRGSEGVGASREGKRALLLMVWTAFTGRGCGHVNRRWIGGR